MGQVTIRTSLTSQGFLALGPWKGDHSIYEYCAINLGNNSISKLEIVSSLNSFNTAFNQYHFNYTNCPTHYNPKVYLSAFQSIGIQWNYDADSNRENLAQGHEKSGSWPF